MGGLTGGLRCWSSEGRQRWYHRGRLMSLQLEGVGESNALSSVDRSLLTEINTLCLVWLRTTQKGIVSNRNTS